MHSKHLSISSWIANSPNGGLDDDDDDDDDESDDDEEEETK